MATRKKAATRFKPIELAVMGDAFGIIFDLSTIPPQGSIVPGSDVIVQVTGLIGMAANAGPYSFDFQFTSSDANGPVAYGQTTLVLRPGPAQQTVQIAVAALHHSAAGGTYNVLALIQTKLEPGGTWSTVTKSFTYNV